MEKALKRYFPIFVLPTLAAFIIGFLIPFVQGLYLSFCRFTTVGNAQVVGIGNYLKAFADSTFTYSFWFTVLFAAVSTVVINLSLIHI